MDELVAWYRQQLDDDEKKAKDAAQTAGHKAWDTFGYEGSEIADTTNIDSARSSGPAGRCGARHTINLRGRHR